jgi:hypothetical protein
MSHVYYACDWIIQPLKPSPYLAFLKLYDTGIENDCLFLRGFDTLRTGEDGIHLLGFLWQAPSLEKLQECWKSVDMEFINCKPIPESEFVGVGDPHAIARIRVGSDFNVYMDRMADENLEILNRKQSKIST